jgi:streptogramin lyase
MNYHFIWVPNTNLGTVSKVDTRTGNEVGRYRVNSNTSHGGDPSRTTVDLKGDVWVGTRRAGTVVKIGDYESGHCLDRNGDGAIETSRDTNNDGNITGAELLDWGKDECVLYEVVLISGKEGTFIPGNYTGSYDTDFVGTAPRGLAIDANNNLWAGTYTTGKYFYIDGATGQINKTINVPGHWAYGAVIDKNGILWSAKLRDHILRINTSNLTDIKTININNTYGFCLDYSGHLFTAGFQDSSKPNRLAKFDINGMNPVLMWDIPAKTFRGVVATRDNNIWVAGGITTSEDISNYNSVSRYDNNGTLIKTISGFKQPSGVAVDKEGKVWVTDIGSNNIYRIDPATNTVDLTKDIIESGGHYTYSDMTGFIARTITTTIGTWTVIFDSGTANIPWGTISWNSSEPSGTSVKVSVRTSNDKSNWSAWKNVASGFPLDPMLNGRYVEMETTLQILSGNTSPILYDLTVSSASYNP